MKDELSLAGETEDVQAVKAKIMKLFKDIVSTLNVLFCWMSSLIELSMDDFCGTKGQKSINFSQNNWF